MAEREGRSLSARLAFWMVASTLFTLAAFAASIFIALWVEAGGGSEAAAETSEQMLVAMLVAGPLALVVGVGGAIVLSRRALAPLDEVIDAARSITASGLDRRLALPRRRDELYLLVEEFNKLFARLEEGFGALSRYAADASHELRTPLAAVASELDVALRHPRTPEEWAGAAERALQETRRLARLVESLLALARADGPIDHPVRFDLRQRVDEVLASTADRARARGLVASAAALGGDRPAWTHGDPEALSVAVRNLVDNAIRYTPAGGMIQVGVTDGPGDLSVAVEDTGPGIPEAKREAIFVPLRRGDGAGADSSGTGLGLAISRRIVERHGGTLSLENGASGGAKFVIRLPPAPRASR